MKKISRITVLISLVLLQIGLPIEAQDKDLDVNQTGSIEFIHDLSWDALLNKAKQNDKIIFIDVYTTWCVPCKKMEMEIFPLKKVSSFYNNKFINYQANAENGVGKKIAKKFKVHSYPTYLFVNKEGMLVSRGKGYDPDPERFLDMGRTALRMQSDSFNLAYYRKKYLSNQTNKPFLKKYLQLLYQQGLTNNKLLDQYVNMLSNKEFTDRINATLIINLVKTSDSKAFKRILRNQKMFAKAVSWDKTRFKRWKEGNSKERLLGIALEHIIMPDFIKSILTRSKSLYRVAIHRASKIKNAGNRFSAETIPRTKIKFYANLPDTISLVRVSSRFADSLMGLSFEEIAAKDKILFEEKKKEYETHRIDSARTVYYQKHRAKFKHLFSERVGGNLWAMTKHYYYLIQSKQKLTQALQWIKRAVRVEYIVRNRYMYARLLYKLNYKQKAIQEMEDIVATVEKGKQKDKLESYKKELKKMMDGIG